MKKILHCETVVIAAVMSLMQYAPPAVGSPQLIRIGTTPEGGRVTFANITRPDARRTVLFGANPVIRGDNLYAPDLLRVDDRWYCYHGGWLTAGQSYDRVYVGISPGLDTGGPWNPASQVAIYEGSYIHVNDPSVAVHDGVWYMLYTAFKMVGSDPRDWINYSTSADGLEWAPSVGTPTTEIVLDDPDQIAGGTITDIARPSLVRTPTGWKLWFDATVGNSSSTACYLAHSNGVVPSHFTLVHKYSAIEGFPGFWEPDVVRRPDGTYLAVVQRHFRDLLIGTSTDGIHFTLTPDVSATNPLFGREKVSNPGLVYDQIEDRLLGLSFGMTDSASLVDHDIGFSAAQYAIEVRSPGNVWHVHTQAAGQDLQSVLTVGYSTFDLVRITDPLTSEVVLEQSFATAAPGDLWHVQWHPDAPVIAPVTPDPDSTRARTEYVRPMALLAGASPMTWSLLQAPEGAWIDSQGVVRGWNPQHDDFGRTLTFEVHAENAAGAHAQQWCVQVLRGLPDYDGDGDVDQSDFGYFQRCITSVGVPQTDPTCEGTSLDSDADVDTVDLALFLGCMQGPNVPINPACLD